MDNYTFLGTDFFGNKIVIVRGDKGSAMGMIYKDNNSSEDPEEDIRPFSFSAETLQNLGEWIEKGKQCSQ